MSDYAVVVSAGMESVVAILTPAVVTAEGIIKFKLVGADWMCTYDGTRFPRKFNLNFIFLSNSSFTAEVSRSN